MYNLKRVSVGCVTKAHAWCTQRGPWLVILWLQPGVLSAVLAWRELRLCYGYNLGCCLLCWLGGSSGYTMATTWGCCLLCWLGGSSGYTMATPWGVVCCVGLEGAQVMLWLHPGVLSAVLAWRELRLYYGYTQVVVCCVPSLPCLRSVGLCFFLLSWGSSHLQFSVCVAHILTDFLKFYLPLQNKESLGFEFPHNTTL